MFKDTAQKRTVKVPAQLHTWIRVKYFSNTRALIKIFTELKPVSTVCGITYFKVYGKPPPPPPWKLPFSLEMLGIPSGRWQALGIIFHYVPTSLSRTSLLLPAIFLLVLETRARGGLWLENVHLKQAPDILVLLHPQNNTNPLLHTIAGKGMAVLAMHLHT